ncbi:NUDIX domain-containing protein [Candidatus Saccharibacteria bacterium]|nr:NUDIX domain-containing protein [Candidatus Saccharibacteria bacterium]MCB9835049.1 NUDIX domain-containing protein [Candidatus Nomurabacteria bacterium]
MEELWQLYDKQGRAISSKGATKDDVFNNGLLHSSSHVWIWRARENQREILLQQRASDKHIWPNRFDTSAAGHIDLDEKPLDAAIREIAEEIGLTIVGDELNLFCVHRTYLKAENGSIENEFQWLYSLELTNKTDFVLQPTEVKSLKWIPLEQFKAENKSEQYLPHGELYYNTVVSAIESAE